MPKNMIPASSSSDKISSERTIESFIQLQHKQADIESSKLLLETNKLHAFSDLEKIRMGTFAKQSDKDRTLKYTILLAVFVVVLLILIGAWFKDDFLSLIYDASKLLIGGLVGFALKSLKK